MDIRVNTASSQYDVSIGAHNLQEQITRYESLFTKADKIVLLTDAHVWEKHQAYVEASIPFKFYPLVLPAGEACKAMDVFESTHTFLISQNCTRKSLILALGGGAVGDLAGFVAATYMRGIPFIQIPTTILAHDSAVGGKTAINHPHGKNLIGAFYQPEAVIYDMAFLHTLPEKEVRSGMTEVIKHAMLSDEAWLMDMMQHSITTIDHATLSDYIAKGVKVKAAIVSEDETEQSVRKYLNLGHTYGHAVEAAAGYGKLTHGEAVMIGLLYTLLLSEVHGSIDRSFTKQFVQFAATNGYPLQQLQAYAFEDLAFYMMKDKKAAFGEIQFVLLEKIGQPFVKTIEGNQLKETDKILRQLLLEVLA